MTMTCDMEKYLECPLRTREYVKSTLDEHSMTHDKNRSVTATIGGLTVELQRRVRHFYLQWKDATAKSDAFFLFDGEETYMECSDVAVDFTAHVDEYYRCLDSTILFLDLRHGNAVIKEVNQVLTFAKTSDLASQFRQEWGSPWYHKLNVTNAKIETRTTLYVIVKGVKTILKSTFTSEPTYVPTLIVPQPPSMAIPLDPEIIAHGFYDYMSEGGGADYEMAQADGGQDYYFPEWCRRIGTINQALDIQEATDRFYAVFLHEVPPVDQEIVMPPISTEPFFSGSMAVDSEGNVFYSMVVDGIPYNFLTGGNPGELVPMTDTRNTVYFPVSPV